MCITSFFLLLFFSHLRAGERPSQLRIAKERNSWVTNVSKLLFKYPSLYALAFTFRPRSSAVTSPHATVGSESNTHEPHLLLWYCSIDRGPHPLSSFPPSALLNVSLSRSASLPHCGVIQPQQHQCRRGGLLPSRLGKVLTQWSVIVAPLCNCVQTVVSCPVADAAPDSIAVRTRTPQPLGSSPLSIRINGNSACR